MLLDVTLLFILAAVAASDGERYNPFDRAVSRHLLKNLDQCDSAALA
jgi:hypothetical protein